MSFVAEFNDLMTRGGPIMWVIFVTAWIAFIMLCERALQVQAWIKRAVRDQKKLQKDTSLKLGQVKARRASPASILLQRLGPRSTTRKIYPSKLIFTLRN